MQTANEVLGSGDGGGFDVEGVEGGGGVPCGGGGAILVKVHSGDAFGQHGFVRTCLKNFNGPDQISLPLSSLSRV